MRTRTRAAAVLALAIIGGLAVTVSGRAGGPPTPSRESARRTLDRERDRERERDEPDRGGAKPEGLLDELDEARIQRELLEMEVEADRKQIQEMMTVLRRTELMQLQGFSDGPVIAGGSRDEQESRLKQYKDKLAEVREDFVTKGKELGRVRRRIAALEAQLGLPAVGPAWADRALPDAERILDLVLRCVESWQRSTAPEPRPAPEARPTPEDRSWKDAEQILELIRREMESWRRDPSSPPAPAPAPAPVPEERPAPRPTPEESGLKDAERLLELIRRGVESWQER